MSSGKILEIACFNLESALIAESAGADRIEFCSSYNSGGLTPSYDDIKLLREKIKIPIHVIIRPHARNFIYSETEVQQMEKDILFCKENGVNGIVFGALTETQEIDLLNSRKLISLAKPMPITFHRAIDQCKDLKTAFETLLSLGIDRVLTSGGKGNAEENIISLKILHAHFSKQIKIMPGGAIRSSNLQKLLPVGFTEFHSAAIIAQTETADPLEIKALKQLLTES